MHIFGLATVLHNLGSQPGQVLNKCGDFLTSVCCQPLLFSHWNYLRLYCKQEKLFVSLPVLAESQ